MTPTPIGMLTATPVEAATLAEIVKAERSELALTATDSGVVTMAWASMLACVVRSMSERPSVPAPAMPLDPAATDRAAEIPVASSP